MEVRKPGTSNKATNRSSPRLTVLTLVVAKLAAHALAQAISAYEFHRDEFLYLAMGDHLRLWGMDFPPFIALAANFQRFLFGDHLWAIRVLPALAGAALIWIAVDTAWRLGGGRIAQLVAGGAILLAPLVLRTSVLFQPVVFDQLWWTLALWCLLRRGLDDDRRWWLGVGGALGIGLLTKFSITFIAIPMVAVVALTGLRKDLTTRWPWMALGLSLLLGHPSFAGQVALGWPFFTQMADLRAVQLDRMTWASFLVEQVMMVGPAALLAVVGLLRLVLVPLSTTDRAVGLSAGGAFLFLLLLGGKAYYAGPVYPVLLAAGASILWRLPRKPRAGRVPPRIRAARATLVVVALLQVAYGTVGLPLGLPILGPEPMARYAARLGMTAATQTNTGVQIELPQDYADMLGWEEFADTVARVFNSLPAEDRERASLFGTNYGRAGALDWYGRSRGLPPAVSNVGSYWFWGPGDRDWDVAVIAGTDSADLSGYFREVRRGARMVDARRVPEERDVVIWIVRDPYVPMSEVWPRFEGRN